MAKENTVKIIRIVLICVFAAIFIVSAVMLIGTLAEYRAAEKLYGDIQNDFMNDVILGSNDNKEDETAKDVWTRGPEGVPAQPPETLPPISPGDTTTPPASVSGETTVAPDAPETTPSQQTPVTPTYSERFLRACEFINELKASNPNVIGYIYIEIDAGDESKNISYPLVQGKDNNYYVEHAYDDSELKAGSIFLDYRCYPKIYNNSVSVIYGHNMNNGAMLHNLKYLKQDKYFNSSKITVYTLEGIYTYQPFSIYNTEATGNYCYMFFNSNEQYLDFLNEIQKRSMQPSNLEFYSTDRILTLSTCLNTSPDARLAVHAVLVGVSQ